MLFEIKITGPKETILLNDLFVMDSITDVTDIATEILDYERKDSGEQVFTLNITSEEASHIDCGPVDLDTVMVFKNTLYDRLIALNGPPADQETDLELVYKSKESQ